jgi:anti-sigma factor RsiW
MAIEPTLTAAMECVELERALDAYLDDEFDARERAEADAHLGKCARCRDLVETQGRMRAAIRARLREAMTPPSTAGRAPAALRQRIEGALARRRRPCSPPWARAPGIGTAAPPFSSRSREFRRRRRQAHIPALGDQGP